MVSRNGPPRDRFVETALSAALILFLAAAGIWFLGARTMSVGAANFGLEVARDSLSFGEPFEQEDFAWTIRIANRAEEKRRIVKFETSCGCTSVVPDQLEIPPGESRDVTLHLSFSGITSRLEDSPVPFALALVPKLEMGEEVVSGAGWIVRGAVRCFVEVTPRSIAFDGGDAVVGTMARNGIAAVRPGRGVARVELASRPKGGFEVELTSVAGSAREYQLRITPRADLPVGRFSEGVQLRPVLDNGTSLPLLFVGLRGEKLPDIEATPSVVNFGLVQHGEQLERRIVLRSRQGNRILVRDASVDGKATMVTIEGNAATEWRDQEALRVRTRFTAYGATQDTVHVLADTEGGEVVRVTIPVAGYVRTAK